MSSFIPADFVVPDGLAHPQFSLRMLRETDTAADYEAVMASAQRLRAGSPHGWPRPGFTLAENREDLVRHEQEFLDRVAFAYTVLAPDGGRVLGCVYINPPATPSEDGTPTADVHLWVRDEHHPELTGTLFEAVDGWLASSWPFAQVRYVRTAYYQDSAAWKRASGNSQE